MQVWEHYYSFRLPWNLFFMCRRRCDLAASPCQHMHTFDRLAWGIGYSHLTMSSQYARCQCRTVNHLFAMNKEFQSSAVRLPDVVEILTHLIPGFVSCTCRFDVSWPETGHLLNIAVTTNSSFGSIIFQLNATQFGSPGRSDRCLPYKLVSCRT